MKKLIQFNYRYDFGHDVYVQVLNVKKWSLLQVSFSYNDYAGWPYLQIHMGSNGLFGLMFWAWKLGFDVSLASRTWKWNYMDDNDKWKEGNDIPN
jgi:hypothetical protein